jgi:UPF0271 protein
VPGRRRSGCPNRAQVGYRDLAAFGRRYIDIAAEDLIDQIGALQPLAHPAGSTVSYVKPHGAPYNTVIISEAQAHAVAAAVHAVDPALPVLGWRDRRCSNQAPSLVWVVWLGLSRTRAYRPDGQLMSRR